MAKFKQAASNAALRTGNTIATPVRRGGEIANALWNVERQLLSSTKNIREVQIQSVNAIADNFLNFSKVQGKRYQRLAKGTVNLASAITRRPFMLAGAQIASTLNQGIRQPFKKLLYTPGKMFKGMRNATRIFSKKKGFDFAAYDTHETKGDTWINQIREKRIGFFGSGGSSAPSEQPKPAEAKKQEKKQETKPEAVKPKEEAPKPAEAKKTEKAPEKPTEKTPGPERGSQARLKKMEQEKNDKEADAYLAERGYPPGDKFGTEYKDTPKSPASKAPTSDAGKTIDDIRKKDKEEATQKDAEEKNRNFPDRNSMDPKFKAKYAKSFEERLGANPSKESVVERGKKAKKGEDFDTIFAALKKENPTMAGYIQEQILDKKTHSQAA